MSTQSHTGYFDYNATTPPSEAVVAVVADSLSHFWNPSSNHRQATENKQRTAQARAHTAALIGAKPEQVFYTSGGTEANNWAIKSVASQFADTRGHIITSAIEHPSVLETIKYCETHLGFTATYLKPTAQGVIELADVRAAIQPDTRLISIMYANNETGVFQPVAEIAREAQTRNIAFHVDGVQAVGKVPVDVAALGIDFLSFSAHKFYGPKGIGGLYARAGHLAQPLLHGGGQEGAHRSGTENISGIVGLGKAAEEALHHVAQWESHAWGCKQRLLSELAKIPTPVKVNGVSDREGALSNTVNLCIAGVRAEALAVLLEHKHGQIVAIGSACSNNKVKQVSHVLKAMGLCDTGIQSSIRVSFGRYTTPESVTTFVQALAQCVEQLQGMSLAS